MVQKQTHERKAKPSARPYVQIPTYGKLFQPRGVYDGKMFHSGSKITYTFVYKKEVVSLHYDRQRKAIFYKGHSVANMKLSADQIQHLQRFGSELQRNDQTRTFANAFNKILKSLLKKKNNH